MPRKSLLAALALSVAFALPAAAETIGQNTPSRALTKETIATLPAKEQSVWAVYLNHSETAARSDRAALAAELKPGEKAPAPPPSGKTSTMQLTKDAAWYATPEARAIADNIVSFQIPSGGWGKNQDRTGPSRLPGQPYAIAEGDPTEWHFVGTFDNDATTTEMRFLARAQAAGGDKAEAYRASFLKGLTYVLGAQYPNGGWPQIWPLEGGYHDAITYNDDALAEVASLLDDVAAAKGDYAFVPQDLRDRAAAAKTKALEVVLASQVVIDGKKTVWPQQIDMLTLAPASARNYEMPSLSAAESGDILVFLMRQPNPSPAIKSAVRDGVAWLTGHALHDKAFAPTPDGRALIDKPGAPALWSRYYSLTTGKPIFGDRDRTIHDNVADLSEERRDGYSWFNTTPQKALDTYAKWSKANP